MFSAPWAISASIIFRRAEASVSSPRPRKLMSAFWQYRQPRVQPEKKTAPLPPGPAKTGSSQKWRITLATRIRPGIRQKPSRPADRLTPQARGQRVQAV